jgi:hypothetical protein
VLVLFRDRHLTPKETTAEARGHANGRPIDFGKLTSQDYGMKGCSPPFDFLPADSNRAWRARRRAGRVRGQTEDEVVRAAGVGADEVQHGLTGGLGRCAGPAILWGDWV